MSRGCAVVRQAVCGQRGEGCRTAAALPASRLAASNIPWISGVYRGACRPGQSRNNLSGSDIYGIIPGVICSFPVHTIFLKCGILNRAAEIRIIWENGTGSAWEWKAGPESPSKSKFRNVKSRVADPDRTRIQSGQWIRIRIPHPDPGGQKWPKK